MKHIYSYLLEVLNQNKPVALATIIDTKGSTPQITGASAIFSPKGLLRGTLGGGLLEADAQKKALLSLKKKTVFLYEFSLIDDISSEDGAICGGKVTILIDPIPEEHREAFQNINRSFVQRNPGVLAMVIEKSSEEKISLSRTWIEKEEKFEPDLEYDLSFFRKEIKKVLTDGKPSLLDMEQKKIPGRAKKSFLFLEHIIPFPQLVIAGAGHIGQAVAHLGHLLDFNVTVIDDRPEFAHKERFPEADHIIVENIGRAIRNFPISHDTYIVIVTRGHRHDAEALRLCIHSEAAYIGMIGSLRKIELMGENFLEEGWATSQEFDRVHAPIGLSLNSKTVQEIAISIAAQLVLVRSQIKEG